MIKDAHNLANQAIIKNNERRKSMESPTLGPKDDKKVGFVEDTW